MVVMWVRWISYERYEVVEKRKNQMNLAKKRKMMYVIRGKCIPCYF
jgi:hypothetical protein